MLMNFNTFFAVFFFIFKHPRALKRSWKIFHGVLESPGFFVSKRVVTLLQCFDIVGGGKRRLSGF